MKVFLLILLLFSSKNSEALLPPICSITGTYTKYYKLNNLTRTIDMPERITRENSSKIDWVNFKFHSKGDLHLVFSTQEKGAQNSKVLHRQTFTSDKDGYVNLNFVKLRDKIIKDNNVNKNTLYIGMNFYPKKGHSCRYDITYRAGL